MLRFAPTLALALLLAGAPRAPDAARVLADMRQALGGDAAIAEVQGFSARGTLSYISDGNSYGSSVEYICALPDRFLRVRDVATQFNTIREEDGFSGNERIQRHDPNNPDQLDLGESESPAQKAKREQKSLAFAKRQFTRMAIAMIGISSVDPVEVSYGGQQVVETKTTDVLVLRAADGYEARLFVDATTHLPLMITWMAEHFVTVTSVSKVLTETSAGGREVPVFESAPSVSARPDPRSLPLVEYQLVFDDYRTADGLTWPHKFVEKVGGREFSALKIGTFKLNPKINPKRFDPRKR